MVTALALPRLRLTSFNPVKRDFFVSTGAKVDVDKMTITFPDREFQSRQAGFFRFYRVRAESGTARFPKCVSIPSSGIFSFLHSAIDALAKPAWGIRPDVFQSRQAGFFRFYEPAKVNGNGNGSGAVSIPSSGIFSFLLDVNNWAFACRRLFQSRQAGFFRFYKKGENPLVELVAALL